MFRDNRNHLSDFNTHRTDALRYLLEVDRNMTYQLCEKVQCCLYEKCKVLSTHAEKKDVLLLTINRMHGRRHVLYGNIRVLLVYSSLRPVNGICE